MRRKKKLSIRKDTPIDELFVSRRTVPPTTVFLAQSYIP